MKYLPAANVKVAAALRLFELRRTRYKQFFNSRGSEAATTLIILYSLLFTAAYSPIFTLKLEIIFQFLHIKEVFADIFFSLALFYYGVAEFVVGVIISCGFVPLRLLRVGKLAFRNSVSFAEYVSQIFGEFLLTVNIQMVDIIKIVRGIKTRVNKILFKIQKIIAVFRYNLACGIAALESAKVLFAYNVRESCENNVCDILGFAVFKHITQIRL